jgi:hypothetical protein
MLALVGELALALRDELLDRYVIVGDRRELKVFVDFLGRKPGVCRFRYINAASLEGI